ncbi:MAG: transporter substrate-binding domain-containing protein [Cellulomonadaceae bacterium]|nr:transporter substrate-binding domain-containing protein [Cellulomonadaceae bacterium]
MTKVTSLKDVWERVMKILRSLLATAAVVALAVGCSGGSGNLAGTDVVPAEGSIRIGVKVDQPGLGYVVDGEHVGLDVDIAEEVAHRLGYSSEQIEWVEAPSAEREDMLVGDKVDMIVGTYSMTDERREVVDFAGPYFVAGQDLLVKWDDQSMDDGLRALDGKLVCSVTGSTSIKRIAEEAPAGTGTMEHPGYMACVEELNNGNVDAVTTDDIILAGMAAIPENVGNLRVVGVPFSIERYGIGLQPGSDLCEPVTNALKSMFKDSTWIDLVEQNTAGTDYQPIEGLNPPVLDECPSR